MDGVELDDIRQALSLEYAYEIDHLIRGIYTDQTRARNLKRIMNNLPLIEDGDRSEVELAVGAYLGAIEFTGLEPLPERADKIDRIIMNRFRVKPEREDTITMELMGIVTHMERLADDAERLLRSLPDGVLPENWASGIGDLNQGIAWLDGLTEEVAYTKAGDQKPDID